MKTKLLARDRITSGKRHAYFMTRRGLVRKPVSSSLWVSWKDRLFSIIFLLLSKLKRA